MGRTLQKKKNRSSIPRATQKPKSKRLPIKASPLIAANWDKHLTLSQNYRKLGLASKINARSGGTETNPQFIEGQKTHDPLALASKRATHTGLQTAKVVRDEEGKITQVIHDETTANPLQDPLSVLESETETNHQPTNHDRESTGIIPALEVAAEAELAAVRRKKTPRKQSQREQEWIGKLVEKHGDDVEAMARDRKLNPMQQSSADIGRRVKIWRRGRGGEEG